MKYMDVQLTEQYQELRDDANMGEVISWAGIFSGLVFMSVTAIPFKIAIFFLFGTGIYCTKLITSTYRNKKEINNILRLADEEGLEWDDERNAFRYRPRFSSFSFGE